MKVINNMFYLIRSLYNTTFSSLEKETLYNEDFLDEFSDETDRKTLDEKVRDLKNAKDHSPHTITVSNKTITIVVQ